MVLSAFGVVSVIFGGVVLPAVFIAVIVAAFAVKVDLVDILSLPIRNSQSNENANDYFKSRIACNVSHTRTWNS